ncbi:MAG TPA: dihydropteroate synthase [Gammaproteobacteria bacterium]|nr:dihydropteroate synthase [Gammaproteobacteria bacterium]
MFLEYKDGARLDLSRPRVMGILNVTPDSFADGGRYNRIDSALRRAEEMAAEGADIIDVGGESTRPGAQPVSDNEELERVIPVIEKLAASVDVPLSVDTCKPAVMAAAVGAGAAMINDINALRAQGALQTASGLGVPVCLMHMRGEPRTMQQAPAYADVVAEIKAFLEERINECTRAGIPRRSLLVDPGFGFGKTLQHNVELMKSLSVYKELNLPLVVGFSRKSMLGSLLGGGRPVPVEQRLYGSLAAAAWAILQGAQIMRVHDVAATVDVIRVLAAVTPSAN